MPFYEYTCMTCHAEWEEIRRSEDRDKKAKCPACSTKDSTKRVFSTPGLIRIK